MKIKDIEYNRLLSIAFWSLSLLVLIPVSLVIQYPGNPPNEIFRGYEFFPFIFSQFAYIIIALGGIIMNGIKYIKGERTTHLSPTYLIIMAIMVYSASTKIFQSYSFMDHYFQNGTIYAGTYLPLIVQVAHLLVLGILALRYKSSFSRPLVQ